MRAQSFEAESQAKSAAATRKRQDFLRRHPGQNGVVLLPEEDLALQARIERIVAAGTDQDGPQFDVLRNSLVTLRKRIHAARIG